MTKFNIQLFAKGDNNDRSANFNPRAREGRDSVCNKFNSIIIDKIVLHTKLFQRVTKKII